MMRYIKELYCMPETDARQGIVWMKSYQKIFFIPIYYFYFKMSFTYAFFLSLDKYFEYILCMQMNIICSIENSQKVYGSFWCIVRNITFIDANIKILGIINDK